MTETPPQQKRLGAGMWAAAWAVLLVLVALFIDEELTKRDNPNRDPEVVRDGSDGPTVRLQPNRAHHYLVTGSVNGRKAQLLLDTGATDVVVPEALAAELGLEKGAGFWAQTANGRARVYATLIPSLSIGPIQLTQLRASISPGFEGDTILLGMSALRQLDFSQSDGELLLRQPD